ncbi:MAG: acyl carrier protein [Proteobacteria bacterium]|nr:acyl carrier protein [Pseudomonadota bacterium]
MTTWSQRVRTQLAALGILGDESRVTETESLMDAGVLDSLRLMDLVPELEKTFGITVEPEELTPENFDSISAISIFVADKSRAGRSRASDV